MKKIMKRIDKKIKILLNLEFFDSLLGINARISTDYYLLCRIFNVFDFNEIAKTSSKSYVKNCLDVRNFPQPFFSNHRKVKWSDELPEEFLVDNKVIDL
jgi:hypothetical protein